MRFRMGFCVVYNLKRELIMDGGLIAHFYIRHNTFIGDFLAAVPSIAEVRSPYKPALQSDLMRCCCVTTLSSHSCVLSTELEC